MESHKKRFRYHKMQQFNHFSKELLLGPKVSFMSRNTKHCLNALGQSAFDNIHLWYGYWSYLSFFHINVFRSTKMYTADNLLDVLLFSFTLQSKNREEAHLFHGIFQNTNGLKISCSFDRYIKYMVPQPFLFILSKQTVYLYPEFSSSICFTFRSTNIFKILSQLFTITTRQFLTDFHLCELFRNESVVLIRLGSFTNS